MLGSNLAMKDIPFWSTSNRLTTNNIHASGDVENNPHTEVIQMEPTSVDHASTDSFSAEPNETQTDDESSIGFPRVPMAWRYRQAHADTVESTTAFRDGATYHPLYSSTFHPHRRDYFKTASAIRSMGTYDPRKASKSPRGAHKNSMYRSGIQTLPPRKTKSIVPGITMTDGNTSFYRDQIPESPRSIHAPLSPRSIRDDTMSIGSQFFPLAPSRFIAGDHALASRHCPPFVSPQAPWMSPNFFPVSMLPPPFLPGTAHPNGSIGVPVAYPVDTSLKSNCGSACCTSNFIVLWLIVAVIAIGIIVGVAMIFGRRNYLS